MLEDRLPRKTRRAFESRQERYAQMGPSQQREAQRKSQQATIQKQMTGSLFPEVDTGPETKDHVIAEIMNSPRQYGREISRGNGKNHNFGITAQEQIKSSLKNEPRVSHMNIYEEEQKKFKLCHILELSDVFVDMTKDRILQNLSEDPRLSVQANLGLGLNSESNSRIQNWEELEHLSASEYSLDIDSETEQEILINVVEFFDKTIQDCRFDLLIFNLNHPFLENHLMYSGAAIGIVQLYESRQCDLLTIVNLFRVLPLENIIFIVKCLKINLLISKISNFLSQDCQLSINETKTLISQILSEFNVNLEEHEFSLLFQNICQFFNLNEEIFQEGSQNHQDEQEVNQTGDNSQLIGNVIQDDEVDHENNQISSQADQTPSQEDVSIHQKTEENDPEQDILANNHRTDLALESFHQISPYVENIHDDNQDRKRSFQNHQRHQSQASDKNLARPRFSEKSGPQLIQSQQQSVDARCNPQNKNRFKHPQITLDSLVLHSNPFTSSIAAKVSNRTPQLSKFRQNTQSAKKSNSKIINTNQNPMEKFKNRFQLNFPSRNGSRDLTVSRKNPSIDLTQFDETYKVQKRDQKRRKMYKKIISPWNLKHNAEVGTFKAKPSSIKTNQKLAQIAALVEGNQKSKFSTLISTQAHTKIFSQSDHKNKHSNKPQNAAEKLFSNSNSGNENKNEVQNMGNFDQSNFQDSIFNNLNLKRMGFVSEAQTRQISSHKNISSKKQIHLQNTTHLKQFQRAKMITSKDRKFGVNYNFSSQQVATLNEKSPDKINRPSRISVQSDLKCRDLQPGRKIMGMDQAQLCQRVSSTSQGSQHTSSPNLAHRVNFLQNFEVSAVSEELSHEYIPTPRETVIEQAITELPKVLSISEQPSPFVLLNQSRVNLLEFPHSKTLDGLGIKDKSILKQKNQFQTKQRQNQGHPERWNEEPKKVSFEEGEKKSISTNRLSESQDQVLKQLPRFAEFIEQEYALQHSCLLKNAQSDQTKDQLRKNFFFEIDEKTLRMFPGKTSELPNYPTVCVESRYFDVILNDLASDELLEEKIRSLRDIGMDKSRIIKVLISEYSEKQHAELVKIVLRIGQAQGIQLNPRHQGQKQGQNFIKNFGLVDALIN